jgi:ribonuclease P/MRP protein subunit RPP1
LGRERGVEGMGVNARGVVVNEGIKRSGFRGFIDVIEGGERVVEKKDEKVDNGTKAVGKKGKGKRQVEQEGVDGTPQISKRQAKRMRLEALKAGKEASQKDTPSKALPKELVSEGTSSKEISTPEESDTPSTIKAKANS